MTERITAAAFGDLGLDDWRVLLGGVEANFECGSYSEAGRFAADLAALCDAHDHHASIDLRYPDLVHVMSTTHFMNGLTDRDVTLARAVSALAAERGYSSNPLDSVGARDRHRRGGHRRRAAVLAGGAQLRAGEDRRG